MKNIDRVQLTPPPPQKKKNRRRRRKTCILALHALGVQSYNKAATTFWVDEIMQVVIIIWPLYRGWGTFK